MKIFLFGVILLFSTIVLADSTYLGFGTGLSSVSESDSSETKIDDDVTTLYTYAGHEYTDSFSLELAYLKSASGFETRTNNLRGDKLYASAWMPTLNLHYMENHWKLFILGGVAFWEAQHNDEGEAFNSKDMDAVFGAGIEYRPKKFGLRLEWRRISFDDDHVGVLLNDVDWDAFLISFNRYF